MCSTMAFFNKKLLTGQGCMINHWCPSAVLQRKKHLIHGYCNSVELANMTVSRWSQPPGALQPEHFQMKSFWLTTTSQNVQVHFPKAEHCSGMELHIAECRALISIRKYQSVLTQQNCPSTGLAVPGSASPPRGPSTTGCALSRRRRSAAPGCGRAPPPLVLVAAPPWRSLRGSSSFVVVVGSAPPRLLSAGRP